MSIGDVIEKMFVNPSVEYESDDKGNTLIIISGKYRPTPYEQNNLIQGSITYSVNSAGTVFTRDDPDRIRETIENFAVIYGAGR